MATVSSHALACGEAVTLRAIRPADSGMENEFVRNLSLQTQHYRFLCGVSELPPAQLRSLCDVDGVHSMAFVATVQRNGHETQVGVSRYTDRPSDAVGEMAVTVADPWQHQGLGKLLVDRLISYARTHGVRRLHCVDLANNLAMRELAAELGMTVRGDPDDLNQLIYSLVL
jgi:GNAT superfamily N-acetyltransferase